MLSHSIEDRLEKVHWRWIFGAVIVAGGMVWAGLQYSQNVDVVDVSSPDGIVQPSIKTVTALGHLQPQGETIRLSAPTTPNAGGNSRVAELRLREGDRVAKGQVVAVLDSRDRLRAAVEEAKSQVKIAQAKLAQVQAGSQQGDIDAQSAEMGRIQVDVQGNEIEQQEAIARLEAQYEGDLATQQAALRRLKATYQNAKVEYERFENLHQQGAISDSQRDSKRLAYESAKQQVAEANAAMDRTAATAQRQIKEAKARLSKIRATGQRQLQQAEATLARVSEVRSVDVATAEAEVDRAKAVLQQAEVSLAEAYVRSPQSGVILEVFARPGEVLGSDGIAEIGQTQNMYAIAEIYQSDIAKVQVGQSVDVSSDSLSEVLHGTVERIDSKIRRQNVVSSDPTDNIDSRVVEAHIRLDPESSQQVKNYTNLQVKVVIQR